ncbi:YggS family pyridoxal phosphate-dependent enzyme [Muricauda sp. SCSIO 64092]|uniref:YggS family pyridoxal phosphate-dependent enzyme n=1 Tax=Allomuricauda sp. SCSIO 64092 TaxID=2908842 RepID=UPI001FF5A89B|nr:YggS family pyridoxal phosphate-dependent enzyme [Muricauda sp. SCSIO 64092]UOY06914.1 YggS family pyridoxal phosphate-dependent enzyme [Muricauda sp. SCSIO 64092]
MSIQQNLDTIRQTLPNTVTLVAVSKTKPLDDILAAYQAGHRVFGENKIQEMTQKWEALPKDIQWHMIGHVQRNKVKYMAAYVSLIHGVDSLKLLKEIDKQAKKHQRNINCLLQIHIAEEETKFGLSLEELEQLVAAPEFQELTNVTIKGVMGMATFTQNTEQIRKEFRFLKSVFGSLQQKLQGIDTLSMGMSGDYGIAVAEGSTMVRIGSSIFGVRNYP